MDELKQTSFSKFNWSQHFLVAESGSLITIYGQWCNWVMCYASWIYRNEVGPLRTICDVYVSRNRGSAEIRVFVDRRSAKFYAFCGYLRQDFHNLNQDGIALSFQHISAKFEFNKRLKFEAL
jgi:hypothetical protein